ncbi:MAG: hypothetical protein KIS85_08705 [Anaerolineales bacterium]|nr:hypothetical protein [Anaerolineales bacterium]
MLRIGLVLLAGLLAACSAPVSDQEAAVATMVAGTLQAQVAPTDTGEPIDGEIQPQSVYGDCPNSGQLSVAYLKDGNIWLWVQGGGSTQLTSEGDAFDLRISGDGCRVAYARQAANPGHDPAHEFPQPETISELWVVSSDGSDQQSLAGVDFFATLPAASGSATTLHYFEWQPGSRQLAFGTRQAFSGPGLISNGDIYLVDADLPGVTLVLPAGAGGRFVFSPDGEQIAFAGANHVGVVRADGTDLRANLVTFPLVITYSEYQYEPPLHWTPAGDLIFALPPEDMFASPVDGVGPETSLWYLPLDGSPAFEAGAIQAVMFPMQEVAFSPDGGRIAYLRPVGNPADNERELVIALSNGGDESAWFNHPNVFFGDWAPDGERYIFSFEDGEMRLMISNPDGSLAVPVALPGLAGAPAVQAEWVTDNAILVSLLGPSAQLGLWTDDGVFQLIDTLGFGMAIFDAAP